MAGLIASMVMGMVVMVYEAVAGAGFWSPVVVIAATILRDLQAVATPVPFFLVAVVLGLMGHLMNSLILGVVFARVAEHRVQGLPALAVSGAVYGLLVFGAMWFIVLPRVDPVMLQLNGPVFALTHVMWGGALGLLLGWQHMPMVAGRHAQAH